MILARLVGDDDDFCGAFGCQLMRDLRHRQHAVDGLPARHRDRIVVENLVGDVDLRRDGRANGEQPRMKVGTVAEVREDVLFVGERRLARPRHAFAAHLAERARLAVHPERHVVAPDAGHRARAFGHVRRRVVRTARAEPRLTLGSHTRLGKRPLLRLDHGDARFDARTHVRGQLELLEPRRDRLRDQRRRKLVVGGQ